MDLRRRRAPVGEFRARPLLDEPQHGQAHRVPHQHLHQDALALARKRVLRREHGHQGGQKPQQHGEMLLHVHAERRERDGRPGNVLRRKARFGGELQDLRVVAGGAKPAVHERDEQHEQEEEREVEERIPPEATPHAPSRGHGVLVGAPLREEEEPLEEEHEQPRQRRHKRVRTHPPAEPGARGRHQEDKNHRQVPEKHVHHDRPTLSLLRTSNRAQPTGPPPRRPRAAPSQRAARPRKAEIRARRRTTRHRPPSPRRDR